MFVSIGCSKSPKPQAQGLNEQTLEASAQEIFIQGNQYLDAKDWKQAVETYKKAKVDGKRWDIYLNRGIAEIQLGKFSDALLSFELALKNGGEKEAVVYFNLGNLYQERGFYTSAIDAYRAGLVYVPEGQIDIDLLTNLGSAYVFARKFEEANETYNYLQGVASNNPAAQHGLGMVFLSQDKYRDAIAMFEQVNLAFPNFAMAYYTKGEAFARRKQYSKAVESFENYTRLAPDSAYRKRVEGLIQKYSEHIKSGK